MHSPTSVTPEPSTDVNSSPSRASFQSFDSLPASNTFLEQEISSLSASPLTVRTEDNPSHKSGFLPRRSLQDIIDSNSMNNTPNKSSSNANQTPLRSTPFLTPPSSDERPLASSFPLLDKSQNRIPLTEKILAQSAMYSQAIQKQQQQYQQSLHASNPLVNEQESIQVDLPLVGPFSPSNHSIPHLTYHQLQQQQQQQFLNRQFQPSQLDSFPTSDHTSTATSSLTAVELPTRFNVPEGDAKEFTLQGEENDGAKAIASIPKADPLENPLQTTNVYINGLPLRWTDDDLYRLTRGFGAVKSVKMFTRHLEDKPSAYGFVLFNCVEDAERFIVTLRQHTNYHPSFAKTAKVPGTTNSKHAISDPIIPLPLGEDYADISITGLPLTIDMQTLKALFAPQVIKESKFFHTTGNPRRLVGFIRLSSSQAAEDIIERLHGSDILGWTENLTVQSIGFGSGSSSGLPNVTPDMLSSFSAAPQLQTGAKQQVQKSPVFDVAASKLQNPLNFLSNVAPVGGYRQDVQETELSRLLDFIKLSNNGATPSSGSNVDFSFQTRPSEPQGFALKPSPIVDLNQLPNLVASNQTQNVLQQNPNAARFGLGISLPGVGVDNTVFNNLALQQIIQNEFAKLQLQQQDSQHQPTFGGVSERALPTLQAAVAMQDNGHNQGNNLGTIATQSATSPFSTLTPSEQRGFWQAREPGMELSANGVGFHQAGPKLPPPLLTSRSFSSGSVPQLLPALTPSSPHGSSEEPSPITPTFPREMASDQ